MALLVEEYLNCHDGCSIVNCPNCSYVSGEYHFRADADIHSGELSVWSDIMIQEGEICPVCNSEPEPNESLVLVAS